VREYEDPRANHITKGVKPSLGESESKSMLQFIFSWSINGLPLE